MPSPMSTAELEAVSRRAEAATAGPWRQDSMPTLGYLVRAGADPVAAATHLDFAIAVADAAFVAHSREDVPRLLATIAARDEEIERLQAEVARLQQRPDEWEQRRARFER